MENKKENFFGKFLKYTTKYRFLIFSITLFSLFETVAAILIPKITGVIITALSAGVTGGASKIDLNNVFQTLWLLALLFILLILSKNFRNYFSSYVSEKITYRLREDVSQKINKLSLSYIEKTSYGDIMSRMINDTDVLGETLTGFIGQVISSVLMGIGIIYMMFSISWEMTWISFACLPIVAIPISISTKKSKKYYKAYRESIGKVNACTEESFSGYETLKSFGAEKSFEEKFNSISDGIYECDWKTDFYSSFIAPVMGFVNNFNCIISCVVGGYFAVLRGFPIGDITSFIAYAGQLNNPIIEIGGLFSTWQNASAAAERIYSLLNAKEESSEKDSQDIDSLDVADDIEFKHIQFGYKEDSLVINDLSLKVPFGQSVAIVGETGAGKTTLVNLLLRFYDLNGGSITFKGIDIRKINMQSYRKYFGIVTQDSWLYKGTILENIRYGDLNATDEEVKNAAKFVGIDHFIESLPMGYETVIEEQGSNISEGQKQLLCIARLVLSKAEILILDEATAAVDTHTESHIQNVLSHVLKNKTSIIIAHRLSTIKNADVIVVMSKGNIVEMGSHNELIEKDGMYAELYKSQFKNV